ncbi:MAG: amidophosphoribosyltransferase, partial [Pyrinomonadaceae bacterium]
EEVQRFIEADSLRYLSLEGMLEACGFSIENSCVACWTGNYPTQLPRQVQGTLFAGQQSR